MFQEKYIISSVKTETNASSLPLQFGEIRLFD